MKTTLRRAVAVSAVCAAGLAGTLTTPTTATAEDGPSARAERRLTDFGMKANVYGTKVLLGGVELKSLKDARANQPCTRTAGLSDVVGSLLSTDTLPVPNDLVHLSPSTSSYETYETAGRTGVRGINTIADIAIGGEVVDDLAIPTLKIEGLRSVADSFYDRSAVDARGAAGAYGTDHSFGFEGISLDYDDTVVEGTPLADLLDIVNDATAPVSQVVDQLVELLSSVAGNTVEIPGLGSIGLGRSGGTVGKTFATSETYALKIDVDPSEAANDSVTTLQLGRAKTRISSPVRSGVFRSTVMGLDLFAGNDLLHMGGIGTQTIPCEGTGGDVRTKTVEQAQVLLGGLVTLTGLEYEYSGEQLARGRARSMVASNLGRLEIPSAGLVITGIGSRIDLLGKGAGTKVARTVKVKVGEILLDGESIKPDDLSLGDQVLFGDNGVITFGRIPAGGSNFYGTEVSAISVRIPGVIDLIDVGWAGSRIYPR